MSDILVCAGLDLDAASFTERLRWTPHTKAWSSKQEGLTWIVTRVDSQELWAPARDPVSGICALLGGRIAPEEEEWKAAEALPFRGGLACRLVIDRWLKGGAKAVEALNGGAQIILTDERERALHVWTDRMGFYPGFASLSHGFLLCSHPDVAAEALEAAGHTCAFDPVTMAEFLRTGTATHPHTYWKDIHHLQPATHFEFEFGSTPRLREKGIYWLPAYMRGEPYLTGRSEIVERLAAALSSSVAKRTLPRLGKLGVLLSAGADSRTALFGACAASRATCFTLYDEVNPELRGAKALADGASAKHVGIQRSKEYYFEHAPEAVRVSGGMWSIESAHHTGIKEALLSEDIGTVLSGCYADYMLKGITYNSRNKQFLGRNIPLYEFAPFQYEWHHPHCRISPAWDAHVELRLQTRYSITAPTGERMHSAIEYARLMPIVREPDAAGRLYLRKTTPVDHFMSDNDVVDMFGRIVPREKLNAIPFGMAVDRIAGRRARHVLNNNYGARVGASEWERVASFVIASLKRKIRRQGGGQPYERDPNSIATVGSWPYFPRAIKLSERLRAWRAGMPREQEDLLFTMVGAERRTWPLHAWADHEAFLFLRLYTASLWLSQNSRALRRVEPL